MIYTKYGILASVVPLTEPGIANALVYTCPANRRARLRVLAHFTTNGPNGLNCLIHSISPYPFQRERQRLPFSSNIGDTHVFTVDSTSLPIPSTSNPDGRTVNSTVAMSQLVFELNPDDAIWYSQDISTQPKGGIAYLMGYEYIPEIN